MTNEAKETKQSDLPRLYWNEHGAVRCSAHAPIRGTDTWNWERWARFPRIPETAPIARCECHRQV